VAQFILKIAVAPFGSMYRPLEPYFLDFSIHVLTSLLPSHVRGGVVKCISGLH
jgi:hypothetical protein